MFAKIVVQFIALAAIATSVLASPVALNARTNHEIAPKKEWCSFNRWGGFASLDNFDNFYGVENFDGSHHQQVIVQKDHELVCRTQRVEIIQQRMVVLQEMAKRIITEHLCDVEAQTIVFQQWYSGLHGFSRDLRRHTKLQVGFDHRIAGHFRDFFHADGSWNFNDFGFKGHDLGKETVVVRGHNWDDTRSRITVEDAYRTSRDAFNRIHPELL